MGNTVCILDGLNMKLLLVSTLALGVFAGTRQRRDGHAEGGDHDVMGTSVIDTNMDDYSDSSDEHGMGDHEKDGHGKGGKGGKDMDGYGKGDRDRDGKEVVAMGITVRIAMAKVVTVKMAAAMVIT